MGVVYKAEDTKLHRSVALKFLPPELTSDETAKTRFIHEAQAASALDHQNIAVVHEIDETDDGQSFICMAYYEGDTLKQMIEKGPVEIGEAIRIGIQIADGLNRAHEAGIVHRDIKPANLIMTKQGDVKIVDFGIAKLGTGARLTKTQTTAGTAAYMSPEQATGRETDQRSDLFSLGVVLYELLAGKRPFIGEHEPALFYSIVNMDPVPPSRVRADIPPELERIILKLLEKDTSNRYQSALELRRALRHLHGMTESTRRIIVSTVKSGNRPLTYVLAGIVIVLLLISFPAIRTSVETSIGMRTTPPEVRYAVLPFTNIGGDSDNQVLCDGLIEILTSKLSRLRSPQQTLCVIASSEIRDEKITAADKARRKFEANFAVTGSFQREGEQISIILNLVDAKTLRQMDSRLIRGEMSTFASLQNNIVDTLVAMLNIPVETTSVQFASAGNTKVSDAYKFYVQGRGYLFNYQRIGNIDLAIPLFEKSLKEDSLYALAYSGLGEAYWRKYEATKELQWVDKATRYCKRGAELDPTSSAVPLTLGIIYSGTGKYPEAISEYQKVIQQDPASADAYRGLAKTYNLQGKYDQAEQAYKKAISIQPSYWVGHTDLGSFYYFQKRYNEALEQFKLVVDSTPTIGYRAMGAMYVALERPTEAEEALKKSIAIEPTYIAYNNLATLYFRQARHSDAAATYEKALVLNDQDYRVWANLASMYYWSEQRDKAKKPFERAVQMAEAARSVNPRDPTVLSQLGDYYSMLGRKTKAMNLTKQALTIAPENLQVMKRAVDAYEQIGQRDQALFWMEQGLKKGVPTKEFERDPGLKELRLDPKYTQLIEKLGKKP